MRTQSGARRMRIRYANRLKCLLVYAAAFALPVLWQWGVVCWLYPYRLAGTAPGVAQALMGALPRLAPRLAPLARQAALPQGVSAAGVQAALAAQERQWLGFLCVCAGAAWALTLVCQLLWRVTRRGGGAAALRRAVRSYRLTLLCLAGLNAAFALAVWALGARLIVGASVWDGMACYAVYALNLLAAVIASRYAAPPCVSGKHGFFRRL